MNPVNFIGIVTDNNIASYLASRNIPSVTPDLPKPKDFCTMHRRDIKSVAEQLLPLYSPTSFNVVVGGAGYWHHLNLGLIDFFHGDEEFDIHNIDNHWDTNNSRIYFGDPEYEFVDCGSHLAFPMIEGRKILISGSDRRFWKDDKPVVEHVLRFVPEMEGAYSYESCEEQGLVDKVVHRDLQDGLSQLGDRVYMTLDIDALSSEEFLLRYRAFSEGASGFSQGHMSREDFLGSINESLRSKTVIGANLFGFCDDPSSADVYDYVIDNFRTFSR